jgi:hypothetical protein
MGDDVDRRRGRPVGSRTHTARGRGPTTPTIARLPMTEDEWLDVVLNYAHAHGWLFAHFHKVRIKRRGERRWITPVKGDAGSPDCLIAHPERHLRVLAELKLDGNYPRPDQRAWLEALGPSDGRTIVAVWKPADEAEVKAILEGSWWPV